MRPKKVHHPHYRIVVVKSTLEAAVKYLQHCGSDTRLRIDESKKRKKKEKRKESANSVSSFILRIFQASEKLAILTNLTVLAKTSTQLEQPASFSATAIAWIVR